MLAILQTTSTQGFLNNFSPMTSETTY